MTRSLAFVLATGRFQSRTESLLEWSFDWALPVYQADMVRLGGANYLTDPERTKSQVDAITLSHYYSSGMSTRRDQVPAPGPLPPLEVHGMWGIGEWYVYKR